MNFSKTVLMMTGLVLSGLVLSGCAAVMEGTTQDIVVNTNPQGASCSFSRDGEQLGAVLRTPAVFHVDKTKDNLIIRCDRNEGGHTGYVDFVDPSGYPKDNWLYILVGGPVGWGYDSAVGADNMYASPVTIDLSKK